MSSYPTQTIPVVDLNAWRAGDGDFARQLGEALEEYGFVAVENHGVRASTRQRALDQVKTLFALDDQVKLTYERPEHGRQRGFTPCGVERAKDVSVADLKEFWHIGPELTGEAQLAARIGANVWPAGSPSSAERCLSFTTNCTPAVCCSSRRWRTTSRCRRTPSPTCSSAGTRCCAASTTLNQRPTRLSKERSGLRRTKTST